MNERQIQSEDCEKQHAFMYDKLKEIEKKFDALVTNCSETHAFLFGGVNQHDGHLSFVDKVNLIYENQQKMIEAQEKNRKFMQNCLFTFGVVVIGALVGLGTKIAAINYNADNLKVMTEKIQILSENDNKMAIQLAKLEAKER